MKIETLLYETFGPETLPAQRVQKCQTVYHLARTCSVPGYFVDLGTWHGYSAIAMAAGAQESNARPRYTFTVDAYTHRHGWAGEPYEEEDKAIFEANRLKADAALEREGLPMLQLFLHRADALQWGARWLSPIALLHWDLGCDNRVEKDLEVWLPHVVTGGGILIHDTMDHRFGALALLEKLEAANKVWAPKTLPAGLQFAIRRP